jgi:hypothetical protein
MIKINWNVTIDKNKKMGVRIIYFTKPYVSDPFVSKIVATWKVVEFSRDLGIMIEKGHK